MTLFYVRMSSHHSWRKFYTLMILLVLLLFHFNYAYISRSIYDLMPSSAMFVFLFFHCFTERVIYFLQDRRHLFICATVAMVCLFIPQFFSTAVTMGILLFGTTFYPSKKVRERISDPDYRKEINAQPDKIIHCYHDWND